MTYTVQQYRNPVTGKLKWAVLHVPTQVWYFPKARGKTFAVRLMAKLKEGS